MIKSLRKNRIIVSLGIMFIALLAHPITRPVMIFILPLGSGPDDLIMVTLVVLFVFIWKDIKR